MRDWAVWGMEFYVGTGLCEEIRLYEGLGCVARWGSM